MTYDAAVIGSARTGWRPAVTLAQEGASVVAFGPLELVAGHWPARLLRVEPSSLRARA